MIKLFITPSCLGCKNAKQFFQDNNVEVIEKDFTKIPLEESEIKDILYLCDGGLADLIATKSATLQNLGVDVDSLKISEVIDLIITHPEIIHRPIIIQYDNNNPIRLLIGFNRADIKIFLNNDFKKFYKYVKCDFNNCLNPHRIHHQHIEHFKDE